MQKTQYCILMDIKLYCKYFSLGQNLKKKSKMIQICSKLLTENLAILTSLIIRWNEGFPVAGQLGFPANENFREKNVKFREHFLWYFASFRENEFCERTQKRCRLLKTAKFLTKRFPHYAGNPKSISDGIVGVTHGNNTSEGWIQDTIAFAFRPIRQVCKSHNVGALCIVQSRI